jgi:hypothetical protein
VVLGLKPGGVTHLGKGDALAGRVVDGAHLCALGDGVSLQANQDVVKVHLVKHVHELRAAHGSRDLAETLGLKAAQH